MKVYKQFLASYLCVCLVPLLLSFFTIGQLESRVQASIMADQESSMQSVGQEIDQTLGHAANLVSIFSEDALASRLSQKEAITPQELFSLCDLSESLSRAIGQNAAFFRGFCYFANSGFLVTDRRTYHPESAELFSWDLQLPWSSFYSLLDSSSTSEHITTVYKNGGGGWIMVLRSQYDSGRRELLSCVGIVIQLDKSLSRWNSEDFEAFVTDEAYKFICGGERAPEACGLMAQSEDSSGEMDLEGQRYVYSQYQSGLSGVRYGFLTRRDAYYQELRIVWTDIILEIAVILVVSVLLAVLWSRRTYRPIKSLLPYVGTDGPKPGYRSISELDSALVSFAQEKESLATQVVQSELSQYLQGLSDSPSALSQFLEEGQPYQLLAFVPAADSDITEVLLQRLREGLDNMLLDKNGGVSLQLRSCAAVLVQKELSYDEAAEVHFAAERSLSIPLCCYISGTHTRLEDAPVAWSAVYRTLCHDSFWGLQRRRGVRPAKGPSEDEGAQSYKNFLSHQRALTECLSAKKERRAAGGLNKILKEDLSDRDLPVENIRRRYADVVELLLPYVPEERAKSAMGRFRQCRGAAELEQELLSLFGAVFWGPGPDQVKQELTKNVREFIRENFTDQSLNASMIAGYLNMNLSTLSHQYKAAAGCGLLDELHKVRLENAKTLLSEGASVREAAERSGYADQRALIRAFKRYEGITPGQYAKGGSQ